jgi:hypothetical protein
MMHDTADQTSLLGRSAVGAVSSISNGMMGDAQDAAAGMRDNLRNLAAETSGTVTDSLRSSMGTAAQMANETLEGVRSTMNQARSTMSEVASAASDAVAGTPQKARQAIGENAALIGGLGIAIGAILAASLPKSRTEAAVIGPAADGVKRAAGSALQSGLEEVKEAAMSAAAAAVKGSTDSDFRAQSGATADVATAAANSAGNFNSIKKEPL